MKEKYQNSVANVCEIETMSFIYFKVRKLLYSTTLPTRFLDINLLTEDKLHLYHLQRTYIWLPTT